MSETLVHWGILGMKWGVRKDKGRRASTSTSIRGAFAKRANAKVDQGFKDWKDNTEKRDNAIALGKASTVAKRAYNADPSNKEAKAAYKQSEKEYKKALSSNTTYRKGVVKQEVGQDRARKYLSDAKKVSKQLDADPINAALKKQYNSLMDSYNVERASARRAVEVGQNRSRKIASLKRAGTMAAKAAVGTAAVAGGLVLANKFLAANGHSTISKDTFGNMVDFGKKVAGAAKFI